jgi:acyl-CoA dehydrogenase
MRPTSGLRSAEKATKLSLTGANGSQFSISGFPACINALNRWISGTGDPRTKLYIVMGKSDPDNKSSYNQQSVVLVPTDTPGITVVRPMKVFGYDDAPGGHCEIIYENVRVPLGNLVLGWGRGFEVSVVILSEKICTHLRLRSSKVV